MNATIEAARIAQTLIEANGPTVRAGVLARHHDVSGISGVGIVAFWVEAEEGPVVLWGWRCDGIEWFPSFDLQCSATVTTAPRCLRLCCELGAVVPLPAVRV